VASFKNKTILALKFAASVVCRVMEGVRVVNNERQDKTKDVQYDIL
jgi:hypothetical protein